MRPSLNKILHPPLIVGMIQAETEMEEKENDTGPSYNEVFECLETVMKWLKGQENSDHTRAVHKVSRLNVFYLFQKTPSGGSVRIMRAHISPCLTKIGRSVQRAVQSH